MNRGITSALILLSLLHDY